MDVKLAFVIGFISLVWVYLLLQDLGIFIKLRKEAIRTSFVKLDKGFLLGYGSILLADLVICYLTSHSTGSPELEEVVCKYWILALSGLFLLSVIFSCIMTITPEYIVVYGRKINNDNQLTLTIEALEKGRCRVTFTIEERHYVFETAEEGIILRMLREYYIENKAQSF